MKHSLKLHENKKRFGLIGYPLKHSLSKVMMEAAFKHYGIAMSYELIELNPEPKRNFKKRFLAAVRGLDGFSVTAPYKESMLGLLTKTKGEG